MDWANAFWCAGGYIAGMSVTVVMMALGRAAALGDATLVGVRGSRMFRGGPWQVDCDWSDDRTTYGFGDSLGDAIDEAAVGREIGEVARVG